MRPGIYLPEDLEERWASLQRACLEGGPDAVLEAWRTMESWRRTWRGQLGEMTWQQRRRLHKLLKQPVSEQAVDPHAAELLRKTAWLEAKRRELRQVYGDAAADAIEELASRVRGGNFAAPTDKAFDWAERAYLREYPGDFRE